MDDVTNGDVIFVPRYHFVYNDWLSVNQGYAKPYTSIGIASKKEQKQFGMVFNHIIRKEFTDGHIWFSLISRPSPSSFTRVQRLSCCLSLLFTTMIANAMWYRKTEEVQTKYMITVGPISISSQVHTTIFLNVGRYLCDIILVPGMFKIYFRIILFQKQVYRTD